MNRYAIRLVSFALLVGLFMNAKAEAAPTSADVVKATATADKPDGDGKQTVTISIAIDKPWHLYANPVQHEDYAKNATLVEVSAGAKLKKVDIAYPEGAIYKYDKDTFRIYEDAVTIKAMIVRAKGDTSPLSVLITVNACNKDACLFKGTIKLDVK